MSSKVKVEDIPAKRDVEQNLRKVPIKPDGSIEWNVDMKVTVSSAKKSKILQRTQRLVILILAVIFAVALSHLKREVRVLQLQVHYVNTNLVVLMSRYESLNRKFNRVWPPRSNGYQREIPVPETIANPRTYATIGASSYNNVVDEEKYESFRESTNDRVLSRIANSTERLNEVRPDQVERRSSRKTRAIFQADPQNATTTSQSPLDNEEDDVSTSWRESRAGRPRRDDARGKKRRKNKRRPKRSRRRLGPLVATFIGAIPEQHVTDAAYIGPWVRSTKNDSQYSLNRFHLVEDKKSIEITASGLYMISAQIFYFGEPSNYSYWILLDSEGTSVTQKLVKCATASASSASEVSCHTSVVAPLRRGDRLHVQQQERNRLINMRAGHSYIQLVLLSNNVRNKRWT